MKEHKEFFGVAAYRFADSLIRYITSSKENKQAYNPDVSAGEDVCIVLDKGMGDFILFSYYLKKLIEYYATVPQNVWIIADSYNIEFLQAYVPELRERIIILKVNGLETLEGKKLESYRGRFNVAILPMYDMTPRCCQILRVLSPNKILSVGKGRFLRKYSILDYRLFKTVETFNLEKEFYCNMHRKFLMHICGDDYGLALLHPATRKRIVDRSYFIINISASNKVKLLPFETFLNLAELLSNHYDLVPVIIGELSPTELKKINTNIFVCDYVNSHSILETISLCEHAEFVVTSDTGIYHLALSIPNKKYVIIPTWSKYNTLFEPYPLELENGRLKYFRKYINCSECPYKRITCSIRQRKKNTVSCVSKMKAEEIYSYIVRLLDK